MYGDFSRVLDALSGQYSAVLAQQGRLLLDAELNEQTAILLDYMRQLATDLIGPFGGPEHHCGFGVEPVHEDEKFHAVRLSRGHYYVYGLRCASPAPHHRADAALPIGQHEAPFVVYMVVWEQSVSAIQAPELLDPALASTVSDTSRRSQVRWQAAAARHLPGGEVDLTELHPDDITRAFHEHDSQRRRCPTLEARAHDRADPDPGPAAAPDAGGYRGVENQLYRVEVHHPGDSDAATFKWSRDNGCVEFGLDALSEAVEGVRTATLQQVWKDSHLGLEVGEWVEFVDDHWAPMGIPAPLMLVSGVSMATRQVTLDDSDTGRSFDARLNPLLRRWDQQPDVKAPELGIPLQEAKQSWLELEDGVQIQFKTRDAHYERGDFWLIPARTAIADVLWPRADDPEAEPPALPPHGPERYLTPLALVTARDKVDDLRIRFGHRVTRVAAHELMETRDHDVAGATDEAAQEADDVAHEPEEVAARAEEVAQESQEFASERAEAAHEADDVPPEHESLLREAMHKVHEAPHKVREGGHESAAGTAIRGSDAPTLASPIQHPVSYRVRSISSVESGTVFPVHDGTTVGRAPEVGIHLEHPDISRHHAVFGLNGDVLTITDLGSTNGTEVNDQRLPERVATVVAPGDTIQLGSRDLQLQVEEA